MANEDQEKLEEYETDLGGVPTTVQLSAAEAERYGDRVKLVGSAAPAAKRATPANKAATPENKS